MNDLIPEDVIEYSKQIPFMGDRKYVYLSFGVEEYRICVETKEITKVEKQVFESVPINSIPCHGKISPRELPDFWDQKSKSKRR